jgi:N-acetylmuramoyl-L-alanine amidase
VNAPLNLTHRPSPNFNERAVGKQIDYIIFHYTGMHNAAAALERLCDPAAQVSAHYLIHLDGRVVQLVAEEDRAWHAGKSSWRGETDINSCSIGIELVNKGHEFGYRPFPKKQLAALRLLTADIMRRQSITPHNVLGHSDIAPQRKDDPGELFPWHELAADGIGIWPKVTAANRAAAAQLSLLEIQKMLALIGYDCPQDGDYTPAMRRVLLAFQRHWYPRNLTGTIEVETTARVTSLYRALAMVLASGRS